MISRLPWRRAAQVRGRHSHGGLRQLHPRCRVPQPCLLLPVHQFTPNQVNDEKCLAFNDVNTTDVKTVVLVLLNIMTVRHFVIVLVVDSLIVTDERPILVVWSGSAPCSETKGFRGARGQDCMIGQRIVLNTACLEDIGHTAGRRRVL